MDADSIHQRTGDLGPVGLYLRNRAGAFVVGIAVVTAGAGVYDSDQHKPGRAREGGRCTGDGYPFLF